MSLIPVNGGSKRSCRRLLLRSLETGSAHRDWGKGIADRGSRAFR